jgi:hypothetical protein
MSGQSNRQQATRRDAIATTPSNTTAETHFLLLCHVLFRGEKEDKKLTRSRGGPDLALLLDVALGYVPLLCRTTKRDRVQHFPPRDPTCTTHIFHRLFVIKR